MTLDGREVFRGVTPVSLGYVTLPLAAAEPGRTVRIALADETRVDDAFGRLTELAHASNASDRAPVSSHSLGFVELEFYEAAP